VTIIFSYILTKMVNIACCGSSIQSTSHHYVHYWLSSVDISLGENIKLFFFF